jgi:hypothetical protein
MTAQEMETTTKVLIAEQDHAAEASELCGTNHDFAQR